MAWEGRKGLSPRKSRTFAVLVQILRFLSQGRYTLTSTKNHAVRVIDVARLPVILGTPTRSDLGGARPDPRWWRWGRAQRAKPACGVFRVLRPKFRLLLTFSMNSRPIAPPVKPFPPFQGRFIDKRGRVNYRRSLCFPGSLGGCSAGQGGLGGMSHNTRYVKLGCGPSGGRAKTCGLTFRSVERPRTGSRDTSVRK